MNFPIFSFMSSNTFFIIIIKLFIHQVNIWQFVIDIFVITEFLEKYFIFLFDTEKKIEFFVKQPLFKISLLDSNTSFLIQIIAQNSLKFFQFLNYEDLLVFKIREHLLAKLEYMIHLLTVF